MSDKLNHRELVVVPSHAEEIAHVEDRFREAAMGLRGLFDDRRGAEQRIGAVVLQRDEVMRIADDLVDLAGVERSLVENRLWGLA